MTLSRRIFDLLYFLFVFLEVTLNCHLKNGRALLEIHFTEAGKLCSLSTLLCLTGRARGYTLASARSAEWRQYIFPQQCVPTSQLRLPNLLFLNDQTISHSRNWWYHRRDRVAPTLMCSCLQHAWYPCNISSTHCNPRSDRLPPWCPSQGEQVKYVEQRLSSGKLLERIRCLCI